MAQRQSRIVVVGAGISGLAVGHYLSRTSADFVVIESAAQPGGVIETRRADGHVLDLGPQRTRLTAPFLALIDHLGLSDHVLTAPALPLFIFSCGKLREVPLDVRSMLTTDLITWADRLRALAEPLTRGVMPGESTAEFFVRKFGRRTYERVLGPLFGDLYGSDPAEMPARHALASYLTTLRIDGSLLRAMVHGLRGKPGAPTCSFRDGMQTLTDALAASLGDRIRTSTTVRTVRRNGTGYLVVTDDEEIRACHVVLTCPAAAAARLLASLDADAAECCAHLRYNPLAVVHLHSDVRLDGMGYQVTFDTDFATRGVTCNHALFGRQGVYTAFLGGATRRSVSELSDTELGRLAAEEFEEITGAESQPLAVHWTKMPAWDSTWDSLERLRLPKDISVCANWRGRPGITGRLGEAAELAGRLAAEA